MTLHETFIETCEKLADKPAYRDEERTITFSQALEQATLICGYFRYKGGDEQNVAILMPGIPEFAICFYGLLKAGKTVVPINPLLQPSEMVNILADAGVKTVLSVSPLRKLGEAIESASDVTVAYIDEAAAQVSFLQKKALVTLGKSLPDGVEEDSTAVILYTSGTVGNPKGVVLSHGNLLSNANSADRIFKISENDTILCVLPLFHSFALTCILILATLSGARVVFLPRFHPKKVMELIARDQVTFFMGVPSMYGVMARQNYAEGMDISSIRMWISGGAALPMAVAEGFRRVYGKYPLQGYGLTETSPVVALPFFGDAEKPESVGKVLPGVRVKIVGDDGVELPEGATGEIMVNGPNVMQGYYNNPTATAEVLQPDGWLLTGDWGKLDEEGFLHICGRKKDIIISAGENIYPVEIEEVILASGKAAEVAVTAMPDDMRGEVPVAYVVAAEEGADEAALEKVLRDLCRERLAAFKVPKEFRFRKELPKGATGKVLKRKLA
ncbi:MAG: AMP-binding protein [Nitrospirota bacterium]|nr:AMP-binding protein [Nitrospirota bacterium]